jgi:hypothetical protein
MQLRLIWLCMVLFLLCRDSLHAASNPSFEQPYYDIGYKSINESVKECQKYFQRDIKLPKIEPPVTFTHRFGRCTYSKDLKHEINNHYEVEYLNQNNGEIHFMIRITPQKYKIKGFPGIRETMQTYTLQDGTKAIYGTTPINGLFNVLVFDKDGWQYILSSDRRLEIVTADVLVQIANSINES